MFESFGLWEKSVVDVVQCLKTEINLVFQYTVSEISFFLVNFGKSCSAGKDAGLQLEGCQCKPHWALG